MKMKRPSAAEVQEPADTMLGYAPGADRRDVGTDTVDIVGTGGRRRQHREPVDDGAIVVAAAGLPVVKPWQPGGVVVAAAAPTCSRRSGSGSTWGPTRSLPSGRGRYRALLRAGVPSVPTGTPGRRREIGVPTVFNLLGPLTNPASDAAGGPDRLCVWGPWPR